jgi:hypothetical protein
MRIPSIMCARFWVIQCFVPVASMALIESPTPVFSGHLASRKSVRLPISVDYRVKYPGSNRRVFFNLGTL